MTEEAPAPPYGQALAVAEGLRRLLAPNPSPMTGTGTMTYLLGQGEVAVIDPGPDDPRHLAAILGALGRGERISHIFVTHAHRDHSGLAPALARETGAPVVAFGDAEAGRSPLMAALAAREAPLGGEGADRDFRPDATLADGEAVATRDWTLTALHTPGHFGNHLCLQWGADVFAGDHVMGWSTSIVAPPDGDMSAYMASLDRLAAARPARLWPGHGEAVTDPAARIAELATHRRARARAIATQLQEAPASAETIARAIYTDIPEKLMRAASLNVFAHLIEMAEGNLAEVDGDIRFGAQFRSI